MTRRRHRGLGHRHHEMMAAMHVAVSDWRIAFRMTCDASRVEKEMKLPLGRP